MANGLVDHDGLVLRNEGLHNAPANEVGHGADAEDHHVGGGLAVETEEGEVGTLGGCPCEELARAHVDSHGTETASHRAETHNRANR